MLQIQNPYKSYISTWFVRLIRINLICMLNINIRICMFNINIWVNLICISLTDEVDPYDLGTTQLTHTQHKCVSCMLSTTNQPPQQWTLAPSPSPKLTYRKKKSHMLAEKSVSRKKKVKGKCACCFGSKFIL